MKFAIVSKGDEKSNTLSEKLKSYLTDFKLEYDEIEPEITISVGETVHCYQLFNVIAIVLMIQHLSVFIPVI